MNTLKLDDVTFELEEATIYGMFTEYGRVTWDIGIFPDNEKNQILFYALSLKDIYSPASLSNVVLKADVQKVDLQRHTVIIEGEERSLESIDLKFGSWSTEKQMIPLSGKGIIQARGNKHEVPFELEANLRFLGINLFETSEGSTEGFVKTHLPSIKDNLHIKYQKIPSGLHALITGRF